MAIFFYLDTGYWNSWAFVFLLVNKSSLFDTILACFRCFLSYLRPSSTDGKGAKNTDRGTYIRATSIESIYIMDTWA